MNGIAIYLDALFPYIDLGHVPRAHVSQKLRIAQIHTYSRMLFENEKLRGNRFSLTVHRDLLTRLQKKKLSLCAIFGFNKKTDEKGIYLKRIHCTN